MKKTHKLKIMPEYFEAIIKGSKYYEIRKDDRDFEEEDILILQEFEKGQYTGRFTKRRITHVLRNVKEYGLEDGYCILSIDEELKEMPLICLRCRKYIPLTMKTFREIGYTKYSYCNECLHEGMRLLRNKDQAEFRNTKDDQWPS